VHVTVLIENAEKARILAKIILPYTPPEGVPTA